MPFQTPFEITDVKNDSRAGATCALTYAVAQVRAFEFATATLWAGHPCHCGHNHCVQCCQWAKSCARNGSGDCSAAGKTLRVKHNTSDLAILLKQC
jgi:hypothetical protein